MVGVVHAEIRNEVVLSGNEIVRVQILNPDGSVKSTEIDQQVPVGKTFTGALMVFGQITNTL